MVSGRVQARLIMLVNYAVAYMPIALTSNWIGAVLYLALLAWSMVRGDAGASLVAAVLLPLLAVYNYYSVVFTHPLGVFLYMLLVYIPALAVAVYAVKVNSEVQASAPSLAYLVGALYGGLANPVLAIAYAAASGAVALSEAFSTPWLPFTAVLSPLFISSVLTGDSSLTPKPVMLFTTDAPIIIHPVPTWLVTEATAVAVMFTVGYLAGKLAGRLIPLPNAQPLLAGVLGGLPALPLGFATWVAGAVSWFMRNVAKDEVYNTIYGHITHIATNEEKARMLEENWNVLIGMDSVKSELIKVSESFESGKARPIHGILLFGPAGTGKTALALGYAAWLGLYRGFTVIVVKTGELMREGARVAAWHLELIFKVARALQPSVIVIDEVESIGMRRSLTDRESYYLTTVLLQNIDGVGSRRDKVLVIGTTNNIDALDEALIRPGRLGDVKVIVDKPNPELVKSIITGIANRMGVKLSNEVLEAASKVIETGAEAESLVNCIAVKATTDVKQQMACLAGVTTGLKAYEL